MAKRVSAVTAKRRRAAEAKCWDRTIALLSQRDQLVDEILVRSRAGAATPLVKKANTLLTRFWARAEWDSREELLRTARWLLSVEAARRTLASAQGRSRKVKSSKAHAPVGLPIRGASSGGQRRKTG